MAKVLLVKPRFLGTEFMSITHPIGLMYIASSLVRAGHEPRIYDCGADPDDLQAPARIAAEWRPDCIGLSVIVSELEQTAAIIDAIRQSVPDVPIVLGGPWPSANPSVAITELGVDFVSTGEGELTFPPLVDAIAAGRDRCWIATNLSGVATMCDGQVRGPLPAEQPDLDTLPYPAWNLVDQDLYARTPSMAGVGNRPYMTVVTSRGCPFHCSYCHATQGKRFRPRSAESVVAEMKLIRQTLGIREFEIVDDCFNLDRGRMRAILNGIISDIPDARLHFPNGVRSDHLNDEDVRLMRRAGTVSCCFAIETAVPELQKAIHKNLDIEKAKATIKAAVREGIYSTGFFMLGLPRETADQARATVRFALDSPLHKAIFMLTTPFAGTELAEMAAEILGHPVNQNGIKALNYFTNTVNISAMSDEELNRIYRSSHTRFYMNPLRAIRIVLHHPRKASLPHYGLLVLAKMLPGRRRIR